MGYFMLDFCYFGNGVLLAFLFIFPRMPRLFDIAFACASGPLIFSVKLFRNSIVFHSVDKMTSCFIHVMPFVVCYTVRFRTDAIRKEAARFPLKALRVSFEQMQVSDPIHITLMHTWCYPMAF